ncbi:hypothetical protein [uncultured Cohaesibacter sp.]|uniref:hypothetical protein n=1 Tax=uncultured Cohaesibacter sp. TaxID=1002546 RepID=UPI002AAB8150|nr:hypothetical protein [uncultured Cohaesibacter sp.]
MRFIMIVAAMLLAVPAQAFDPEPWQTKSVEAVMGFGKIKRAEWSQNLSLWVFAYTDETDWGAAGDMLCKALNGAGKPDGQLAIITIWDYQASQSGNLNQLGKLPCY